MLVYMKAELEKRAGFNLVLAANVALSEDITCKSDEQDDMRQLTVSQLCENGHTN